MTTIPRRRQYRNFAAATDKINEELLKKIYTAMPGIITFYDEDTRRATVRSALDIRTSPRFERIERPEIANVPVVFPSGGGYSLRVPIHIGDAVLLIYSMRGLEHWKETYVRSEPGGGLLSEIDAIALPGFGMVGSSSPQAAGLVIQKDDGESWINLEDGNVTIHSTSGVTVDGGLIANNLTLLNSSAPGGGTVLSVNDMGDLQTRARTP